MKVMISGASGQDASYLAAQCLEAGHEVVAIKRRTSTRGLERVEKLLTNDKYRVVAGDIADFASMSGLITEHEPDEFYHTAAQSFVGASFEEPINTLRTNTEGTLNVLESIRKFSPHTRMLFCATSECFGNQGELADDGNIYQSETTRMIGVSPYGISKVAAYQLCKMYREAYDLHVSSAITFNHECISEQTPFIAKINDKITIVRPIDLLTISMIDHGQYQKDFSKNKIYIWDGENWAKLKLITANNLKRLKKNLLTVHTRIGTVDVTDHHNLLDVNNNKIKAGEINLGTKLKFAENLPENNNWSVITDELAELLGYLVGDGYISKNGCAHIVNTNKDILKRAGELWDRCFCATHTFSYTSSGFNNKKIDRINLTKKSDVLKWLNSIIYTLDKFKKVPDLILNSNLHTQKIFLDAYYLCDGNKTSSAITTNSSVLALGINWLYSLQGKNLSVYTSSSGMLDKNYYRQNILKGFPKKSRNEVRKIEKSADSSKYVFDIEVETGKIMAGIGQVVIANSPKRGEEFVTRKITKYLGELYRWLEKQQVNKAPHYTATLCDYQPTYLHFNSKMFPKLALGNLEAARDWGFAGDYTEAFQKIVRADYPDDYVICTGEHHTIREFLEVAFGYVGLDYKQFVYTDPKFYRPIEVDFLRGDCSKIRERLGWKPKTSFQELIKLMVKNDIEIYNN